MNIAETWGSELYAALRDRRTVAPLIARDPSLTIYNAYAISLDFLSRRLADGERVDPVLYSEASKEADAREHAMEPLP